MQSEEEVGGRGQRKDTLPALSTTLSPNLLPNTPKNSKKCVSSNIVKKAEKKAVMDKEGEETLICVLEVARRRLKLGGRE